MLAASGSVFIKIKAELLFKKWKEKYRRQENPRGIFGIKRSEGTTALKCERKIRVRENSRFGGEPPVYFICVLCCTWPWHGMTCPKGHHQAALLSLLVLSRDFSYCLSFPHILHPHHSTEDLVWVHLSSLPALKEIHWRNIYRVRIEFAQCFIRYTQI